MEFPALLLIAIVGLVTSRVLDRRRKRILRALLAEVQDIREAAGRLQQQLEQATQRAVARTDAQAQVGQPADPRRRRSSLLLVSERVIYTRSFVRTFLDTYSGRIIHFASLPETLAVGVEIDPQEFRKLLKERERKQFLAEGVESLRGEEDDRHGLKVVKPA